MTDNDLSMQGRRGRPVSTPTMKDVAAAAGVGLGTVSRVFSGSGPVAESTRERVMRAAQAMQYRPSALGRGLKSQRTNNIGLIVADISNSFYGAFTKSLLASAKAAGRHVLIYASGEDEGAERDAIELFLEQRVEGIIAFPTGGNTTLWSSVIESGANLVFVDRVVEGLAVPSVVVDNAGGTYALTSYLAGLGHRRIGYLGGPTRLSNAVGREDGYRAALHDAGLPLDESLLLRSGFTAEHARASARELLRRSDRPTAVVASNNILGEAALEALGDLGLAVPDAVSFVMFDDVPWARLARPAVTVVSQPTDEMGRAALDLVVDPDATPGSRVLETEMHIRGSAMPLT